MLASIPVSERNPFWKGPFELLTGSYPRFLFGGGIGHCLPVFHFHDITREKLEPYLQFLAENKYRTVTSEAIARLVREGVHPGPQSVTLCFDDAWASLWTVVAPLLSKYNFQAITYVAPGRITDAESVRPSIVDPAWSTKTQGSPFATWPELRALHTSGIVDIQAHTFSHSKMFSSDQLLGFVTPDYSTTLLSRPLLNTEGSLAYLLPATLGAPLFPTRPRLSDALRYLENPEGREACVAHVRANGGTVFFKRANWAREITRVLAPFPGRFETTESQADAINAELVQARDTLGARLGANTIRHMCFPWTVAGRQAEAAVARTGYVTAFADRLLGTRAVRAGDPPYRLMRLRHSFIFCLPGQGRRHFIQSLRMK